MRSIEQMLPLNFNPQHRFRRHFSARFTVCRWRENLFDRCLRLKGLLHRPRSLSSNVKVVSVPRFGLGFLPQSSTPRSSSVASVKNFLYGPRERLIVR